MFIERKLQEARAKEALDEVRAQLITSYGVSQAKNSIKGQSLTTRAQGALTRKWKAVNTAADVYRHARNALVALGMPENDNTFRPLRKQDLKAFKMYSTDDELNAVRKALGQGLKAPSWLWERWDFINSSTDPKFRKFFEEGRSPHSLWETVLTTAMT